MFTRGLVTTCALLAIVATAHAEADFTGAWQVRGNNIELMSVAAERPAFTAEGQSRYEKNRAAVAKRDVGVDTVQRCASPGMPRIMLLPYPFEIMQEPRYLVILFEWNHVFRQISIDGQRDPYTLSSAMGTSSGHWQGDTLIVTTTDRAGTTLLDNTGLLHGEQLKITERLRLKNDGKLLEDRITIEDSEFYLKPWEVVLEFERQKNVGIKEDVCLDRVAAGRPPIEAPAERRKASNKK